MSTAHAALKDYLAVIEQALKTVIAALAHTLQLQSDLDAAIDTAGGWPLQ